MVYKRQLIALVASLLLLFASFPAAAVVVALQDIRIYEKDKDTIVDIDLGIQLIYSKHFPHSEGEILQIQMILEADKERTIHKEVRQGEDLKPPLGKEAVLIYVTYEEGVPGGPYLTLRFARSVKFEVNAGSSERTLSIVIKGDQDKSAIAKSDKSPISAKTGVAKKPPSVPKRRQGPNVDQLMAKARQALTFGDNTGAITLLRKIIAIPENPHTQDARELLGLALERDRQIPRAKFEYKKYLRLYKEGEGPKRVKQRLTALQNLGIQRRQRLRVPKSRARKQQDSFKVFGRLSQAYDRRLLRRTVPDENDPDKEVDTGLKALSSRLDTHLNIRGRYRNSQRAVQLLGAGNYSMQFGENAENEGRVTDLSVDYDEIKLGVTALVGRQRARNTGLLGRFDGAMLGYRASATLKPSVYFGSPVYFNDPGFNKRFIGAKLDYGKRKMPLGGNMYVTYQTVDGLDDRKAIGTTVRYADKRQSIFGMVDYDVMFQNFTTYNLRWGLKYNNKTKFNLSYNYRWFLVKSNAKNGQTASMNEIEQQLGEDETLRLAEDRTSKSYNVTLGGSYQLNKDTQITVDGSYFKTYGLVERDLDPNSPPPSPLPDPPPPPKPNPAGLNDVSGSGENDLIFVSAQWISSNTFALNDLYNFGLRFSDSSSNQEYALFINGRLPPYKKFNIRPRLNLAYRDFELVEKSDGGKTDPGSRASIIPSVRVDYRVQRQWVIESEIGYEWVYYNGSEATGKDEERAVFRFGYHYTF